MATFENNPELAFAVYASTAATLAIDALRRAGLVNEGDIALLIDNLAICTQSAVQKPELAGHAEMLLDQLLSPTPPRT